MPTPEHLVVRSDADGLGLSVLRWQALGPKVGAVQISHGMAEHKERYARLAVALSLEGFTVYASDHRGHGESISSSLPLGDFGEVGWDGLLEDLAQLGSWIRGREGAPVFLLAHSMGSMAAQQVLLSHPDLYDGVILSGTSALDELAAASSGGESGGLQSFNSAFEHRTGFEWLSRDDDEVQAYVDDPLCGFDLTEASSLAFYSSGSAAADPSRLAMLRKDVPVLFISGQADPCWRSRWGLGPQSGRQVSGCRRQGRRGPHLSRGAARAAQRDEPRRGHRRRHQLASAPHPLTLTSKTPTVPHPPRPRATGGSRHGVSLGCGPS